jgi:hypothetical protein
LDVACRRGLCHFGIWMLPRMDQMERFFYFDHSRSVSYNPQPNELSCRDHLQYKQDLFEQIRGRNQRTKVVYLYHNVAEGSFVTIEANDGLPCISKFLLDIAG